MRSFEMRLAAVILAIAMTYVYPPSASDSSGGESSYANGTTVQGERSPTASISESGGTSATSIVLPPSAQPTRNCLLCVK